MDSLALNEERVNRGGILLCSCITLNKTCWHVPFFGLSAQAFTAALFIVAGYAMKKYRLRPFCGWQICLGLAFTLVGSFVWNMALDQEPYNNYRFLPYILSASIATWSFYSLFERIHISSDGIVGRALNFIGKHTLTILTWHFLAFKLVSLAVVCVYGQPIERLAEFPVIREYAVQGWWVVYFFVAMAVTCGVANCNKWIRNSWMKI